MNETIKRQLEHKTIREFTCEKIKDNDLKNILDVINRTATSMGMQSFSIVRVTDKDLRKEIAKVTNQEYIARVPELFIFIVDLFRNESIAKEKGLKDSFGNDADRFFQGFTDASLAAQNATCAIESMGLGAVYFGSILNDPLKIVKLLKLPKLTFPVVGLGFGYKNQQPQLKPRMDMSLKLFENEYKVFDNYLEEIKDYDAQMQTYYDLRDMNKRLDSFSDQVYRRSANRIEKRAKIFEYIKAQGFNFD